MKEISLKWKNLLTLFCCTAILSSCIDLNDSRYEEQARIDDDLINDYLEENSIEAVSHPAGFYYEVITENENGASLVRNDVVDFYYKVSLLNGTVIEDSLSAKKPARMKLLNHAIVPEALDRGISLMKVGSTYRFYIPSNLAFGDYKSSYFASRSNFIVDITVASKQNETDLEESQLDSIQNYVEVKYPNFEKFASGLYYAESIAGTGVKPRLGDRVTINLTRRYLDGTVIKSVNDLILNLGYGQAVQGLEEGLLQMREGGKAVLIMPASIAFNQSLCLIPQKTRSELLEDNLINAEVLPYSIVEYVIELKTVN